MTRHTASIALDGSAFDFKTLAQIGANRILVLASEDGMRRCEEGRRVFDAMLAAGLPVYGSTTGVGALKDRILTPDELDDFNAGLVRAHHFGTGPAFEAEVVRAAIAIRVNTAMTGRVGCTPDLVDAYIRLLAADVVPVVRRTGSIGCADIGLMGQIGAVLTGVGEAVHGGRRVPAAAALAAAGLRPLRMRAKDSLASISVNAIGYAAAANALRGGAAVVRVMLSAGLAAASAMGVSADPWLAARECGTPHEAMIGAWLTEACGEAHMPSATHIQDPLSLRMMAQVYAIAFDALASAGRTTLAAIARPDDNPVIVGDRLITSGASMPLDVTLAMQTASLALAHVARNSFNRCVLIGNGMRRGLPINLVPPGVIATGFGPIIKLAGELFARALSMSQPISAQSLVVAGGLEDEAAFLPLVVERFERQVEAVRRLAALEALLAAQAMDILGDRPAGLVGMVYGIARHHSPFYVKDRPLSAEVEAIEEALASPATMKALLVIAPMPEVDAFFALDPALTA
ncbi:aromatic amino acid lyase [Aureimonas leprariae]|uniref:Histidine ammonia-lyase n=1 Tax=Plantimonas leprariae TaxID=2615207 RepID=A0A7V7TXZ0_9HYPH|nr:aromatic amino acid lyase [Aureimonas leprariae]KAB0676409.1 histidine ammonia-lyase [Aureimonas leprariae]